MEEELCKLTLVYPPAAEDTIVELLLKTEPPLRGFTTWAADGHGLDFGEATTAERVRGRIRRCVMVIVLPRPRVAPLLETVRTQAGAPHLAYWVEPVESFGRL
jgi:hypothetical protein